LGALAVVVVAGERTESLGSLVVREESLVAALTRVREQALRDTVPVAEVHEGEVVHVARDLKSGKVVVVVVATVVAVVAVVVVAAAAAVVMATAAGIPVQMSSRRRAPPLARSLTHLDPSAELDLLTNMVHTELVARVGAVLRRQARRH